MTHVIDCNCIVNQITNENELPSVHVIFLPRCSTLVGTARPRALPALSRAMSMYDRLRYVHLQPFACLVLDISTRLLDILESDIDTCPIPKRSPTSPWHVLFSKAQRDPRMCPGTARAGHACATHWGAHCLTARKSVRLWRDEGGR